MFAFAISLGFHIVVMFLLLSGSVFFRSNDKPEFSTVRVNVVSAAFIATKETPSLPPPEKAKKAKKTREALTKLAHYNPPTIPEKINPERPETLISPPKRETSLLPSSAPQPPKKQTRDRRSTPLLPEKREPNKKKQQPSQQTEKKSESKQRQPEATMPKRRLATQKTLASVLKSVQERDPQAKTASKTQSARTVEDTLQKNENISAPTPNLADSRQNAITAQDLAILNQQLSNCWTIISTDRALLQTVRIRLFFDAKFHVRNLEFVDRDRYNNDPAYRVAAEQAKNAILHPACQPLALPKEKISPDIVLLLNFDPKTLLMSS